MLKFINKEMYFGWVDEYRAIRESFASSTVYNLKDIQDHYIISHLVGCEGKRILEVGGGDCRVMRYFSSKNECWNAEKFEGRGIGPKQEIRHVGIRNVPAYLGDFSAELPNAYFDYVISVSVVEHVESPSLPAFFNDISRVLKPGGLAVHAIDAYVFDPSRWSEDYAQYARRRLQQYLAVPATTEGKLQFRVPPAISDDPGFSCEYASNADREMLAWNRVAPVLAAIRSVSQSVSLMAEWVRA